MQEIIVNELIRLERIKYVHAFHVFQAIDTNRDFLSRWLPFVQQTRSQEDTEAFIRSVLAERGEQKDEIYVIWYQSSFAGLIGLKDTDLVNQKTEIGYWLVERFTGKGIMVRAVKALLEFVFSSMKMNRVQIKCGVGNQKSAAIPKRLGFRFEGIEREGEKHQKGYIDLEVYSLLRNEYRLRT